VPSQAADLAAHATRHQVPAKGEFSSAELATSPPPDTPDDQVLKMELADHVKRLYDLQRLLYADRRFAILTVFQGLDAAGKDSTIRKVFSGVNPAGFRVKSFGVPSETERRHDFLWRCNLALPERGKIGIFNRSHYEEVLAVRVHPEYLDAQHLPDHADPERIWPQRFESIRQWEKHLSLNGTVIVKFWLNLSPDEQARRFLRRIERADKNWKFSAQDLAVRERWNAYQEAYREVLRQTSTVFAPWYAIPADDKKYMRVAVARIMVHTLTGLPLAYPRVDETQQHALQKAHARLLKET